MFDLCFSGIQIPYKNNNFIILAQTSNKFNIMVVLANTTLLHFYFEIERDYIYK